jgi:hypothetical protein
MSQQVGRIITRRKRLPHARQPSLNVFDATTTMLSEKFSTNTQLNWRRVVKVLTPHEVRKWVELIPREHELPSG